MQYMCGRMPPWNRALRLYRRCCGVSVAPRRGRCARTTATPSAVVTCSITTLSRGNLASVGSSTTSMNAFSRSNISTSGCDILAMHQQRNAVLGHRRQHAVDLVDRGDAVGRIGGGVGGIELGRREDAVAVAGDQVGRVGRVGEIAGHQRREGDAGGNRRANAGAIGIGHRGGRHRRRQVRHDDGARELAGGERHHRRQHVAVAEMNVPVVGPADRQSAHLVEYPARPRESGDPVQKTVEPTIPELDSRLRGNERNVGRPEGIIL